MGALGAMLPGQERYRSPIKFDDVFQGLSQPQGRIGFDIAATDPGIVSMSLWGSGDGRKWHLLDEVPITDTMRDGISRIELASRNTDAHRLEVRTKTTSRMMVGGHDINLSSRWSFDNPTRLRRGQRVSARLS